MVAGRPKKPRLVHQKELSLQDKKQLLKNAFYESVAFKQFLDLDEWADTYRILPQATASEHGLWSTKRFPFLRKIMRALSPSSKAREINVMKGAQLGFTETAINWLLYSAHHNPGPCLYAQKTKDSAHDFSTQKFSPSIEACIAVTNILGDKKSKKYADSWSNKAYPGGFIVLGGANSSPFLRSKSIRDAILDEEDTYEANVDGEGSPIKLLGKRMVNFPDRKLFRLSTPVLKETSTIEPAFDGGSQEYYYVPCPFCNALAEDDGYMFVLKWDTIKWSKSVDKQTGYPEKVWCECPHCAEEIDEDQHKTWMLDNGDWFSTRHGPKRVRVGDVVNPSFHLSSLYSPHGFFSWSDAVQEWFDYQRTKDIMLLQVFINQTLAETFTIAGQDISYTYLQQRRESYAGNLGDFDVPNGALVLTAGVDIQDDRIELEVVGWGLFDENWSIRYVVIPGDTAKMGDMNGMLPDGQPSVYKLLDLYLMKRFKHESGVHMPIEITMIDCGYKTEESHTFCRLRESRRIFPVRGDDGWGKGYYSVGHKRHKRYNTITYVAYVDEIKNKVYSQLPIETPGPGYCHFPKRPEYSEKYFKGLVCEVKKTKFVNGKHKLYWFTPSGARNEPLDIRNYSYVAFVAYPVDLEGRSRQGLGFFATDQHDGIKRKPRRRGSKGL